MIEYNFNEAEVFNKISSDWKNFMNKLNATKCVIGISGGIDSTCVAALACKIFGNENVYGISMPCDVQKDIDDVNIVFAELKIKRLDFNIGDVFHSIINGVENNGLNVSEVTKINLPPRLRMSVLYAFSQSIPNSLVINTCNLSETYQNYDTCFGDNCGSYAPIQELTKTEVRNLAFWLGVDSNLVVKTPIDGLQSLTDEEKFGFRYYELDNFIRNGIADDTLKDKMFKRYYAGKWKIDTIHIVGPKFDFPNHFLM